jgi:4'-phosphopantetheinyl transferase
MRMETMMSEPQQLPHRMVPEGEAHVWIIALSDALAADARALACLSAEERQRLQRQRAVGAAQRFARTRLALREILAHYTGADPAAVELVLDARGKPYLAGDRCIHFSLSHAGRLALIAVARRAVGVDVESRRQPRRLLRMARRVLHAETVTALLRLPGELRRLAFLDAWTQRESHVKAVGGGIFVTPDELPFHLGQPADGVPYLYRDRSGAEEWSIARFHPAPNARASLVARGRLDELHFFDWSSDAARTGEGR